MANFELNKTSRLSPLYVGKYDFDKTIDKLNQDTKERDLYAASIRDTNALNPDQTQKNATFRQHQDELNSVLNDTTSEPAVQKRQIMQLASKHANDLNLRAYEKSVAEREKLHKELQDDKYAVNADYDKAISDAAFERAGGTKENVFGGHDTYEKYRTPLVPYVDPSKKREEVGSGFKVEGNEKEGYYWSDNQGHRIQNSNYWKGVLPKEVYNVAESSYTNDPQFYNSEKKQAERSAVEELKAQYPDANLADIRDKINDSKFTRPYTYQVPQLDASGNVKLDDKGNKIYKTETLQENPLQHNLELRKRSFAQQTATKFGGLETGNKVDERDDAIWLLNYKRKLGKEDEEEAFRPNIIASEGRDTGFDLGLKNPSQILTGKAEGSIGVGGSTLGADPNAEYKITPANKEKADQNSVRNKELYKKLNLGDSSKLTDDQIYESLNKWNTTYNKRYSSNDISLGNATTKDAITKSMVEYGDLGNSKFYIGNKTYNNLNELVNAVDSGELENLKPSGAKNAADIRKGILDNIKLSGLSLKAAKGLPDATYRGNLLGEPIYVRPENEAIKAFSPYAKLQEQIHNPESAGKKVVVPIYDNSTGTPKGNAELTVDFRNGSPVLVNSDGQILSMSLSDLVSGASMNYHKTRYKLPFVTQTQVDKK